MDVSVIIVSYNTKELTRNCLNSIFEKTTNISFEVIISDNGSTDGSIEMIKTEFPQVVLIENGANIGFGAANNRGAAVSHGKYLFLLNSDTVLLNNAIKEFFDEAEKKKEKTIFGCILTNEDGIAVHSYEQFTPVLKGVFRCIVQTYPSLGKVPSIFPRKYMNFRSVKDIGQNKIQFIIGADLFILKEKFQEINGFDEIFFMYFEDEDLCRRAGIKGILCGIAPNAKIVHLESKSTRIKSKKIQFFEHSFLVYAKRYYSFLTYFMIHIFFFFYSVFRLLDFRFSIIERLKMMQNIILPMKIKRSF